MSKFSQYMYYGIIAVLSVIMLVFFPMLGSEVGLEWKVPNTKAGWAVWVIAKLSSAGLNVLILHCFVMQGHQNVKENPRYVEARGILLMSQGKLIDDPRSPERYMREIYTKKGLSIFLATILGLIGLGQATLTFDPIQIIIQLVSLVVALIFGFLQMKGTEDYYTQEYLDFAKKIEEERKNVLNRRKDLPESSGASPGEQAADREALAG